MIELYKYYIIRILFFRINEQARIDFRFIRIIIKMVYDCLISCVTTHLTYIINDTGVTFSISRLVLGIDDQFFIQFDEVGGRLVITRNLEQYLFAISFVQKTIGIPRKVMSSKEGEIYDYTNKL